MQRPARLILWTAAGLCLLTAFSRGDEEERRPDKATEEFVARWAEKASALKTVDVRFQREDNSGACGIERYEGRLHLKEPNLADLEVKKRAEDGTASPFERLVWTEPELHQFRHDGLTEFVFVYEEKRRQVPEAAALPFLFGMTAEDLLKRYDVELTRETPETFVVLLRPREQPLAHPLLERVLLLTSFSRAYLVLDRQTYLPRRFCLVSPNGKDTKDYRALEIKVNGAIDPEVFQPRSIKGWKVIRSDDFDSDKPKRNFSAAVFGLFGH